MIPLLCFDHYSKAAAQYFSSQCQVNRMLWLSTMLKLYDMKDQGNLLQYQYGGSPPLTIQILP